MTQNFNAQAAAFHFQVKTIPLLQVKISVLQQEKKHLLEELKLRNEDASPSNSGDYRLRF